MSGTHHATEKMDLFGSICSPNVRENRKRSAAPHSRSIVLVRIDEFNVQSKCKLITFSVGWRRRAKFDSLCLQTIFNWIARIAHRLSMAHTTQHIKVNRAARRRAHQIPQHRASKSHVSVIINVHNWVVARTHLIVCITRAHAPRGAMQRALQDARARALFWNCARFSASTHSLRSRDSVTPSTFVFFFFCAAIFSVLIDTVKVQSQRQQHHAEHINCHKILHVSSERFFFSRRASLIFFPFRFIPFAFFSRDTEWYDGWILYKQIRFGFAVFRRQFCISRRLSSLRINIIRAHMCHVIKIL